VTRPPPPPPPLPIPGSGPGSLPRDGPEDHHLPYHQDRTCDDLGVSGGSGSASGAFDRPPIPQPVIYLRTPLACPRPLLNILFAACFPFPCLGALCFLATLHPFSLPTPAVSATVSRDPAGTYQPAAARRRAPCRCLFLPLLLLAPRHVA